MGIFATIQHEAAKRDLRFLVIGGLAVNMYGYSRDTADLDLLALKDARGAWLELFAGQGYTVFCDRSAFVQLQPPQAGAWPVDLMFVNSDTFSQMVSAASEAEIYGVKLLIPSLAHLLALKVHALKHSHLGRFQKDLLDVDNLIRINKVDVRSEKYRLIFLKYGTQALYEQIVRFSCAG